ncbi:MAG: hypothetical protein ACON4C_10660, partial [Henriciella sp.]
ATSSRIPAMRRVSQRVSRKTPMMTTMGFCMEMTLIRSIRLFARIRTTILRTIVLWVAMVSVRYLIQIR